MFGSIGVFEIIIIAGIALMVLGPEKFPEFAKMAARLVRDIRSYGSELQEEISKEIKPVKKELDDLSKIDPEKYIDSLVGDDEDKMDDDMNPEPDRSAMKLYGVGRDGVDFEEQDSSSTDESSEENEPHETNPYEEGGIDDEEKPPDRLDG